MKPQALLREAAEDRFADALEPRRIIFRSWRAARYGSHTERQIQVGEKAEPTENMLYSSPKGTVILYFMCVLASAEPHHFQQDPVARLGELMSHAKPFQGNPHVT